ncbi:TAF5-like RNA polymerase II p300/CBP-associated factor-associated factor 65 kDa subunit 5L [Condylostylus longicornis]|uniref:TAF5-like RNA polymerase II p300/CBP-associated factor-associated factor 65 kDa subunit 5L n=1 Tax=Condylostylus longicornis TaxID=2530218 RepID=UPI00244E2AE4|nr:TAF5-like RNA polymerase II p300/CBP-associated factor-associated factor 65 kDa subunit 5L [Condylostylus longicornis]
MVDSYRKEMCSGGRTRKVKCETIKEKLGLYFRHRNYSCFEKILKTDCTFSQTRKQFVFNQILENDFSRKNSFSYSNAIYFTNNFSGVDVQFGKFVDFVESQENKYKSELRNLYGPLICHLYIELIKCKEGKVAVEFLKKYVSLISHVERYDAPLPNKVNGCSVSGNMDEDHLLPSASSRIVFSKESTENPLKEHFKFLVQSLSTCLRIENVESNEALLLFRSSKYELDMSIRSLVLLRKFLESQGHVIIVNILQSWVNIEVPELKEQEKEEGEMLRISPILGECCTSLSEKKINSEKYIPKDRKNDNLNDKVNKKLLNNYVRRIKHATTKLQNIDQPTRNFIIVDKENSLICSSIEANECHIAGGFGNSVVKLWHINQDVVLGKNLYSKTLINCPWNSQIKENFAISKMSNGGMLLMGHTNGVTDIHFSKDNSAILTSSKDKSMRFWKIYGDESITEKFIGHNHPIWCLSESPITSYVATGSKDLTAKLWSLHRKYPLITYVGHAEDVESIAFHPNGNYVATGSSDQSVRLWSVATGRLIRVFTELKFAVSKVSFSPDGKFLAAAGEAKVIHIFDLAAGSTFLEFKEHLSEIIDICWSNDGKIFATAYADGSIRLCDITKSDSNKLTGNKLIWGLNSGNKPIKLSFNLLNMVTLIAVKKET